MKVKMILPAIVLGIAVMFGSVGLSQEFEPRTGFPPVGHTDPSLYQESQNAHQGVGTLRLMGLLNSGDFETDFRAMLRGVISPKSSIGEHFHNVWDEMYIILDGRAEFTVNGHTSELPAGAMVPCTLGSSHGIYNPTDEDVEFIVLAAGPKKGMTDGIEYYNDLANAQLETPPAFPWLQLDRSLLNPGGRAHDGKGEILFRRLWNSESFETKWFAYSHALLPPDTSIGYHQHNTREEIYYILNGEGRYTANDSTFAVSAGDALPCRLRGAHGIFNDSDDGLELLIFSVSEGKGVVKYEKNLGDTLADR